MSCCEPTDTRYLPFGENAMQLTAYLWPRNSAIATPPTLLPPGTSMLPFADELSNSQTFIAGFWPHSPVAMYLKFKLEKIEIEISRCDNARKSNGTYRPHCEYATAVIAFRDVFNKYVWLSFFELNRTTVHLKKSETKSMGIHRSREKNMGKLKRFSHAVAGNLASAFGTSENEVKTNSKCTRWPLMHSSTDTCIHSSCIKWWAVCQHRCIRVCFKCIRTIRQEIERNDLAVGLRCHMQRNSNDRNGERL